MQRNKLIYALSDASLIVSSDLNKGGTWAGAVEQLDKLKFVPVYVRSTGTSSAGLDALRRKGAQPWSNPQDADAFESLFLVDTPRPTQAPEPALALYRDDGPKGGRLPQPSIAEPTSDAQQEDANLIPTTLTMPADAMRVEATEMGKKKKKKKSSANTVQQFRLCD